MGKRYQSDLTDKQWAIIKPLIPAEKEASVIVSPVKSKLV
jgi:transposase